MGAKIVAVGNQKGGVGKTTTTLTLAAALALLGKKVLAVDMDPHSSASIHLRFYPERLRYTVCDVLEAEVSEPEAWREIWSKVRYHGSDLVFDFAPSHVRLSEVEVDLRGRSGKGAILRQALSAISDEYDYIVLDCPPHVGVLLVNAVIASNLLIVPIQTDFMALHGLRLLSDTVRTLNRVRTRPVDYRALATMYDARASACKRVLDLLRLKLGEKMFETVIHMDTKFREASAQGKVLYELYPESRGAKEYTRLAMEIEAL